MIDDAQIEAVARAMCRELGLGPDDLVYAEGDADKTPGETPWHPKDNIVPFCITTSCRKATPIKRKCRAGAHIAATLHERSPAGARCMSTS